MNQRTLNRIGLLGLALLMFLSLGFVPADQALVPFEDIAGPGSTGAAVAANGMVSTANRYATLAGLETLRAGGNAVDAMAVVQFVLNVAEPYASGIGGGNFIMIYDAASGEVIAIDGREEAPEAYSPDIFLDDQGEPVPFNDRSTGGNPVGVPGTLAATARALEEYGTISLEEALEPAIELARRGFVVDTPFALAIAADTERIALFEATAALYLDEDGQPLAAGDIFSNPDLADTLELIAQQGIEVFYEGEIAEDLVAAVQNAEFNPGVMELTDLAGYRAVRREPVSTTYRGYEVYGMNMPTSGGTTLMMMLNTLEGIDLPSMEWGSLSHIHRIAGAQNLAFADRNAYMGDADFVDVPVAGLLDKGYARERRGLMQLFNAIPTPVDPGTPPEVEEEETTTRWHDDTEGISTTHFSIVDGAGNLVSVTTTIERFFGSGVVVPGRGFLLNNELTDFESQGVDAEGNIIPNGPEGGKKLRRTALGEDAETEGGKRPRSSMSPTLVLRDGQPFMAVGSPGGSRIIGYTLNTILNVVDFDMELQEAVNASRAVARNGRIDLEPGLYADAALVAGLQAKGFEVGDLGWGGSVQAVMVGEDGLLYGAADPRREGLALGF